MDQETKKELQINGKTVTAEKTFTAEKADGSVELEFTFDGSALAGKKIVVFEKLLFEGREVERPMRISKIKDRRSPIRVSRLAPQQKTRIRKAARGSR